MTKLNPIPTKTNGSNTGKVITNPIRNQAKRIRINIAVPMSDKAAPIFLYWCNMGQLYHHAINNASI